METPRSVLRNRHLENVQELSTPLKVPSSPFLKENLLGYGTGVNVYKLERSPKQGEMRSPWAIKKVSQKIKKDERATLFNSRIQDEASILRKLSHPNIVGFRGVSKTPDGLDVLAIECCRTSLSSILEDRHDGNLGPLPAEHIYKMITDIAGALDYLHTEAKLLHGDLKSFNVLVNGNLEIFKLCDFGVSLPLDEYGVIDRNVNPTLCYVGTGLWAAPEVIEEDDIIDSKADIFSFGLVIYETIALVPPHTLDLHDKSNEASENEPPNEEELENSIENMECAYGTRPPLPKAFELHESYNQIVELFYCCTQHLPEDRPSAKMIMQAVASKNDKQT